MPVDVHQNWALSTTSTAGAAVYCFGHGAQAAVYVVADGGSSGTVTFRQSNSSGGPWLAATSTKVDTGGIAVMNLVDQPLLWVRPQASGIAGTLSVELIAAS